MRLLEEGYRPEEIDAAVGYRGFYERVKIPKELAYRISPLQILAPGINEAAWLLRNGIATRRTSTKRL